MTPEIRAKRILSPMKCFRYKTDPDLQALLAIARIELKDEHIGVYQSNPESLDEAVIVSKENLGVLERGKLRSIRFDEIRSTLPLKNDGTDSEITAININGNSFMIPVRGTNGRFQDIFEFLRFIMRSCSDTTST